MAVAIVPNNQIFNAYLVWGDQQFDLVFMGTQLPTTWLVTLDAIVSVRFLAGVALFYRWYGKRWREPDEITKIIIGSAFSIGGMLCLFTAAATQAPGREDRPVLAGHVPRPQQHRLRPHAAGQPRAVRQARAQGDQRDRDRPLLSRLLRRQLARRLGRRLLETMPTTSFWLLHAGFAAGSGAVFVLFKLFLSKRLIQPEPARAADNACL